MPALALHLKGGEEWRAGSVGPTPGPGPAPTPRPLRTAEAVPGSGVGPAPRLNEADRAARRGGPGPQQVSHAGSGRRAGPGGGSQLPGVYLAACSSGVTAPPQPPARPSALPPAPVCGLCRGPSGAAGTREEGGGFGLPAWPHLSSENMLAVHFDKPGGTENLSVKEVAKPSPGAGEVLLKVAASALNRADLLQVLRAQAAPGTGRPSGPSMNIRQTPR